ncbi:MAG: glycosyltransferase [Acidimicrobiia bacterium]
MTGAASTADPFRTRRVVLHVAESFSSGVASAIEAYLDAQPPDTTAVVCGYRIPGVQLSPQVHLPVPFHELPAGKVRQLLAIRREIARVRPDVIHIHSSWAGLMTRVLPLPRGTRVVHTPHCYGFERRDLSRPVRRVLLLAEQILGRRTDVVLACAIHEADLARRHRIGRTVLHFPQQLPAQLRTVLGELASQRRGASDRLVVGMSGRICAQKGASYFAAVARGLRATAEGRDRFCLRWIGGGGPGSDEELRAAGVEVTGWLTQYDSVKQLADCDVYLHSGAWEGLPMTVLEAQELGLVVLARAIAPLVAEPRGARLVEDPRDAIEALLDVARRWPVGVDKASQMPLSQRRAIMTAAYAAE